MLAVRREVVVNRDPPARRETAAAGVRDSGCAVEDQEPVLRILIVGTSLETSLRSPSFRSSILDARPSLQCLSLLTRE